MTASIKFGDQIIVVTVPSDDREGCVYERFMALDPAFKTGSIDVIIVDENTEATLMDWKSALEKIPVMTAEEVEPTSQGRRSKGERKRNRRYRYC